MFQHSNLTTALHNCNFYQTIKKANLTLVSLHLKTFIIML